MADTKKYVVVRSGIRVSDAEYNDPSDATSELEFWQKVIARWPDGSMVEVVEKDEKKHRIW